MSWFEKHLLRMTKVNTNKSQKCENKQWVQDFPPTWIFSARDAAYEFGFPTIHFIFI